MQGQVPVRVIVPLVSCVVDGLPRGQSSSWWRAWHLPTYLHLFIEKKEAEGRRTRHLRHLSCIFILIGACIPGFTSPVERSCFVHGVFFFWGGGWEGGRVIDGIFLLFFHRGIGNEEKIKYAFYESRK